TGTGSITVDSGAECDIGPASGNSTFTCGAPITNNGLLVLKTNGTLSMTGSGVGITNNASLEFTNGSTLTCAQSNESVSSGGTINVDASATATCSMFIQVNNGGTFTANSGSDLKLQVPSGWGSSLANQGVLTMYPSSEFDNSGYGQITQNAS